MYTVVGLPATRTFRVLWALEEMELAYDLIPAPPQSPQAQALSPLGKIPVLKDGEDVITDSVAIMTYLADKHGQLTAPAGIIPRAQQDALIHMINDELDAILWATARHSFVLPEEHRIPEIKTPMKWEFRRNIKHVEEKLTGPYIAGTDFTIADILLTHCLNWAHRADFTHDSEQVRDYGLRMRERPAFQRVMERVKETTPST